MVSLTAPSGGTAIARPRFPEPLTVDALDRALVDPAWRVELPLPLRGRAAEVANHVLVHCLERFAMFTDGGVGGAIVRGAGVGGAGTASRELALAARELLVEFALTAPCALDDGAPAKSWAAAAVGVVVATQCAEPAPTPSSIAAPPASAPAGVGVDRGLDGDLADDDEDDDEIAFVDPRPQRWPQWEHQVAHHARRCAAAMGARCAEALDRAAVIRSTVGVSAGDARWRVPSQKGVAAACARCASTSPG